VPSDYSNGYDDIAEEFIAARSDIGCNVIKKWASVFPKNATILDAGAGHGVPLTSILIAQALNIFAIDASPTLVAAYKKNFPKLPIACEPVESSSFFNRTYDGIMAIGLIFLLPEKSQETVISRLASVLKPGGRFLFSAPQQKGHWTDILTDKRSWSLGEKEYNALIKKFGLTLNTNFHDQGNAYYYEAIKRAD